MGSAFGYIPDNGINLYLHPDVTPHPLEETKFDAHAGFVKDRKERISTVTLEEMQSAKLPLEDRDYCAGPLLEFRACRREKFPWVVLCSHEKHAFLQCKHEDLQLRMKEYERERRLMVREKKIREKREGSKDL